MEELLALIEKIQTLQLEVLDLDLETIEKEKNYELSLLEIKTKINNAVDANGKALYSNAEKREVALLEELKNNPNLTVDKDVIQDDKKIKRVKQIEVEYLNNKLSILKIFAKNN